MTFDDYAEVWLVDFEYCAADGGLPNPVVCMVAREFRSGRYVKLWQDELARRPWPPFGIGRDHLYVAFNAVAEFSCHLALGWPLPENTLDLYVEFCAYRNGLERPPGGLSLLGACTWFGVSHIEAAEKTKMRDLVLAGGPWDASQRRAILDYCQSDVDELAALLPHFMRVVPRLEHALLRGRYMRAVTHVQQTGVPIDVPTHTALVEHWPELKERVVAGTNHHGVYEGTTFRYANFERFLVARSISWPRLASGKLDLKRKTFKDIT